MEKEEKIKILILIIIIVAGSYFLLKMVIYNADTKIKYEFYDSWGNYGTSSECGEVKTGTLSCLVNDTFVPVKQYSKIEEDNENVWKK